MTDHVQAIKDRDRIIQVRWVCKMQEQVRWNWANVKRLEETINDMARRLQTPLKVIPSLLQSKPNVIDEVNLINVIQSTSMFALPFLFSIVEDQSNIWISRWKCIYEQSMYVLSLTLIIVDKFIFADLNRNCEPNATNFNRAENNYAIK